MCFFKFVILKLSEILHLNCYEDRVVVKIEVRGVDQDQSHETTGPSFYLDLYIIYLRFIIICGSIDHLRNTPGG